MPLRYLQVRLKPLQYDYCLFNTSIVPSIRLLPLQYEYCSFNTTIARSIRNIVPSIRLLPDTTNIFPVRLTTLLYSNFVPYPPPYMHVVDFEKIRLINYTQTDYCQHTFMKNFDIIKRIIQICVGFKPHSKR